MLPSRMEGSSNVLSEALISRVPVIATRIPGLVGTLGDDYPGYFAVGDTEGLARLLGRVERDPEFYAELRSHCERARELVLPERERAAWKSLLGEVTSGGTPRR